MREGEHVSHGLTSRYLAWDADATSRLRGVPVLLLHGLESHAGWFTGIADRLAALGHPVFAPDRPGSGASPGRRGDIDDADALVDHLGRFVRAHAESAVVLGHSWGAVIAALLARRVDAIGGVVFVTPAFHTVVDYSALDKVAIVLNASMRTTRYFSSPIPATDRFTDDREIVEWIARDPRRQRRFTARFLMQTRRAIAQVKRQGPLDQPVLHVTAGRDRICDNAANRRFVSGHVAADADELAFDDESHALVLAPVAVELANRVSRWTTRCQPLNQPDHLKAVR